MLLILQHVVTDTK